MSQHVTLIINPISGTQSKGWVPEWVSRRLGPEVDIHVVYTGCRGDATRLAKDAVFRGDDAVLAVGGDGTVNETARALLDTDMPMGILPCGSGNGLARHLGIPVDIDGALDVIMQRHIEYCDYATANGNPFFCTFGVGFDAAVSEKFAGQKHRGRLTYLRNTIEEYLHYSPRVYTIRSGNTVLSERAFLVAVCNASQYGNNAYIAPEASMTDGLLDVTVIHQGTPLEMPWVGLDLLTGYIDRNTLIHSFRTADLSVTCNEPNPVHLDGEPMVMSETIDITCHPGRLRIFTPVVSEPFQPVITPARAMMRDIGYTIRNIFRRQI